MRNLFNKSKHKQITNMKLKISLLSAFSYALLGFAENSQAAVVIGDIISINLRSDNTTTAVSGAAVIGQTGDMWNQITGTGWDSAINGTYALNKTTNVSSGVTMTLAGQANAHGNSPTQNIPVFESGFFLDAADTSATITFSGFTAGTIVDLYLYAGGWQVGEGAEFTFNSITKTAANTNFVEPSYIENNNYVKYSGLVANGSGNITGTWTKAPGDYSVFNGAQIAVIPEPSAALLGGLGFLALLRRRR
jgi:hypothetical protein